MTSGLEKRDPFGRAYLQLRRELADGLRPPGTHIRIDETARAFAISPTPVREALSRLAGERLVLDKRRQGYFVPSYSSWELSQLYHLAEIHIIAAIMALKGEAPLGRGKEVAQSENGASHLAPTFLHLLARIDGPILRDAGILAVERLAPARCAEGMLFDLEAEEKALRSAFATSCAEAAKITRAHFRIRRSKCEQISSHLIRAELTGVGYFPHIP